MEYLDLIGVDLKNEILSDLFETYDVDVIYQYDRLHENVADTYCATIPDLGLEFIFDQNQRLITLFMIPVQDSGFSPFTGIDPRSVEFSSRASAMQHAKDESIDTVYSEAMHDEVIGEIPEWVKYLYAKYSIHYQFNQDQVQMVTIHANNA